MKAVIRAAGMLLLGALLLLPALRRTPALFAQELNGETTACRYRGETYTFVMPLSETTEQSCAVWRIVEEEYVLVAPDVSCAVLCGDMLYYIDHAARTFSIYRVPLSGGEPELLRGDGIGAKDGWPARTKQIVYKKLGAENGALYYERNVYAEPQNPAVYRQLADGTVHHTVERKDDPFTVERWRMSLESGDTLLQTEGPYNPWRKPAD